MNLLIVPSFYAPKSPNYIKTRGAEKLHAISYNQCNFRCEFCGFSQLKKVNTYFDYTNELFEKKVISLMEAGAGFKFTGGEPTLNPGFIDALKCVRLHGGNILVDSNGSNFDIIKMAIDEALIDVLGISLKGLCPEEALKVSGIQSEKLCWDNVLKSIRYAAQFPEIDVIVTYVITRKTDLNCLYQFVKLFQEEKVFFKINNFQESCYTQGINLEPFQIDELREFLRKMADEIPALRGRIILIGSSEGVENLDGIEVV